MKILNETLGIFFHKKEYVILSQGLREDSTRTHVTFTFRPLFYIISYVYETKLPQQT